MRRTTGGAGWWCTVGDHLAQEYTAEDMYNLLEGIGTMLPSVPMPEVPDLTGVRVFIKNARGEDSELDSQFVREHCSITGMLPVAGKPLSKRVSGIPHPFNVITYSEVTRIECP